MRIAFATTEFLTEKVFDGGLASYLLRVSEALIKFGHEPIVFVASDVDEILNYKNIKVVKVKHRKFTWWFWVINIFTFFRFNPTLLFVLRSYNIRKSIEKYNKQYKIDITQYTNSMSLGILLPNKIPSVIRISSYQKFIDQAYGHKQTFRLWQKQYLQDIMLKRAKNIFGPSEIIGNYISEKFNKKVEIIESPFIKENVKTDNSLLNEVLKKASGNEYMLYFGSLTVLKGVTDIAEIIEELFEKYPKLLFVFIGKDIGSNGKPIYKILKEKAGKHSKRIIWYFSTPHNLLYPVIKNAKIVVLPSRIDNFPNTCIEAMSMGKIVIGTNGTSFEQLIDDKISGLLCQHSNPQNLLKTIDFGMNLNESDRITIGEKAIERIDKLKPEFTVKKLLDYYETVISNHHSL